MTVPPPLEVWILAGQSNMQGHGRMSDPRVPPPLRPDDRVWSFGMAGEWIRAEEPLHRTWESYTPAHEIYMRAVLPGVTDEQLDGHFHDNGAGLGLAFGIARADAIGAPVGLLPAAQGGSSLEWWNPARVSEGTRSLYGSLLDRVRRATSTPGVTLGGVLWYQGETDGNDADGATYADRLDAFVAALRRDVGAPDLPLLAVQTGRMSMAVPPGGWTPAGWDAVREALRTLPDRVPGTASTSAIDLGTNDGTHIETPELIRLGRRLARLSLGHPFPRPVRIARGPDGPLGYPIARVVFDGVTGGWTPAARIPGFVVRTPDGRARTDLAVMDAYPEHDHPDVVDVVLSGLDDDVRIGYGLGFDPPCVAVDAADMPIPAFAPLPVEPRVGA